MQIGEPVLYTGEKTPFFHLIEIKRLPFDTVPEWFIPELPGRITSRKQYDGTFIRTIEYRYTTENGKKLILDFTFTKKRQPPNNTLLIRVPDSKQGLTKDDFKSLAEDFVARLRPLVTPTPIEKPTGQSQFQQRAEEYCAISHDFREMLNRNRGALEKYGISVGQPYKIRAYGSLRFGFSFLDDFGFAIFLKSDIPPNTLTFFVMDHETLGHVIGGFVTNTHVILLQHYRVKVFDEADAEFKEWLSVKGIDKPLVVYPQTKDYNIQKSDNPIQASGACQRWYVALPYLIAKHLSNGKPYAEQTEDEKAETHRKWAALGTDWTLVKPVYDEINKKPTETWYKISQSSELVGMGRRRKTRRQKRRTTRRR